MLACGAHAFDPVGGAVQLVGPGQGVGLAPGAIERSDAVGANHLVTESLAAAILGEAGLQDFAINAGAKIAYNFNRSFAVVLSPQGDIAFSKKSELTTTNAWVWPFTAGFRANF